MGARRRSRSSVGSAIISCRRHIGTPSKSGDITATSISLSSFGSPLAYDPYKTIASTRIRLPSSSTNREIDRSRSIVEATIRRCPLSIHSNSRLSRERTQCIHRRTDSAGTARSTSPTHPFAHLLGLSPAIGRVPAGHGSCETRSLLRLDRPSVTSKPPVGSAQCTQNSTPAPTQPRPCPYPASPASATSPSPLSCAHGSHAQESASNR